jgi:hypothetical protein
MKRIDIHHPQALELAVEAIRHEPIIVQMPAVFVLLAAPTSAGAAALNVSKTRLAGKNYGTAIGSLERFLAQAEASALPPQFSRPADFARMSGTFIRVRFRAPAFESQTIRAGTHQGLLVGGVHRELFRRVEAAFADAPPDPMWGFDNYAAPLCTSCNVSGDADGSIVRLERALDFARLRGVRLMLTTEEAPAELGSYPIFGYERDRISIWREGPRLEHFKQQIPWPLRAWEHESKVAATAPA